MRKPLSETLKWYNAQNQFLREQSPLHDVVATKAEETMERYAYLGGKTYDVKILISKAVGLVATGTLGRISPYFYYKFYKDGERYSQISSGTDPIFEDVASFKAIYNKDLIDYLEKESLNVYLFDSMNKIELDINDNEQIKLVNSNQEISKDLIGISRIPLKGLLINDLVQGEFPIVNMKNQKVGKIIVNIFWEEIVAGKTNGLNDMPYETEAYKDEIISRVANVLKLKGLNLDSAFLIFDIDNNGEITIDNFKNVLIYTLKFSTNQSEIEHLVKILFTEQGRTKLSKIDFFKIFAIFLPHEGPASSILKNSSNQIEDNNSADNNSDKNSNTSPLQTNKAYSKKVSKFSINTKREKRSSNSPSVNKNLNKESEANKNLGETTVIVNTNRSLQELGKLAYEYKMKMGGDWSKLFINVDVDGSLAIDKTELRKGYKKMGIELSDVELNKLWRELSPDNKSIDFIKFKTFHEKIFKPNRRKSIPIQSDVISIRDNVDLKTDKNE
jgi:Ca2+-binding EF-hand superfamily protein